MELKQYMRVLVGKWWIIALAFMVTVSSAVVFSEVRAPTYRSSAVLQVIPARFDYGLTLAAEQLLRQFANQIHTTSMAQQVIDELQLDISTDKLLGRVTVAPIPEDFLIQIDADAGDPEEARAVASAFAQDFVAFHAAQILDIDRADRVTIRLLEDARYGWVHWPKTKTLALAGGVLGLLIRSWAPSPRYMPVTARRRRGRGEPALPCPGPDRLDSASLLTGAFHACLQRCGRGDIMTCRVPTLED
jgi:capsular polysaccharide biosynthesis protein